MTNNDFFKEYGQLLKDLYKVANPIIKYRIDKEFFHKEDITIEKYISLEDDKIEYWLNIHENGHIHGRKDMVYENCIAKLLDFGFDKHINEFNTKFDYLLEEKHWKDEVSFEHRLMQTVKYPFLIRAGYSEKIVDFINKRINILEQTIKKYGYDFQVDSNDVPSKYQNDLVFKHNVDESLPTIYDLYAFSFMDKINDRVEGIVEYILDDRFQCIPKKAYLYSKLKKRYYAVGNVYHACIIENRKLLTLYLFSHFKASGKSSNFINEVKNLMDYQNKDGFFEFKTSLLKEKKDSYYLYSGAHMSLGENRNNRDWRTIESTFWMLKIIYNIKKNNINI